MSRATPAAAVEFTAHAPQVFVADFDAACAVYTGKLGFRVAFTYGDPPYYGAVIRDGVTLNLRLICEPVFVGDIREREALLSAAIEVGSAADMRRIEADLAAAPAPVARKQTLVAVGDGTGCIILQK